MTEQKDIKKSSPVSIDETKADKEVKKKIERKFKGIVLSDKMDKTIVVKIDSTKRHPKYLKSFTISKKYKVHDEKNQYKEGDKVNFIECRPLSKNKRWRVLY